MMLILFTRNTSPTYCRSSMVGRAGLTGNGPGTEQRPAHQDMVTLLEILFDGGYSQGSSSPMPVNVSMAES